MDALSPSLPLQPSLRQTALCALRCADPDEKVALTLALSERAKQPQAFEQECSLSFAQPSDLPGRPARPTLMVHLNIPKASLRTSRGLAALVHAVCHIEFNAINLALDAIWRFANMPATYYTDWTRVAAEEAHHFSLLRQFLDSLGATYGDFPAHDGLWDMAKRTQNDPVARMALVPRTLEARGLDATPPMQAKLRQTGTPKALQAVAILDVILRDEIEHVAVGNRWYHWLCEQHGLEPIAHFRQLCLEHSAPRIKAPINQVARRMAGFTDAEMMQLLQNT